MNISRRRFLKSSTVLVGSSVVAPFGASKASAIVPPSERVRVGVMGAGGRALSLITSFARNPEVEIVAIADLDANRLTKGMATARKHQSGKLRGESDFRRMIDDQSIDALVIGTPDHWHAIPTILGCQAGKDVYVEKPDAHNIIEGMRMVAAMRKHKRVVQTGSQHRATQRLQSAIEFVSSGKLGRCLVAKAWESSRQAPVGRLKDEPVPAGVDYDMWQGPAPERPFNRNRFHGRWRWFYDYGTGDLGNDGVHRLDMAIALLDAASKAQGEELPQLPRTIYANGGKWYFDDAQQFPDTLQVNYEFGEGRQRKLLTYEMRIWAPYPYLGHSEGSAVFGDEGYIVIGNTNWTAYSNEHEVIAQGTGDSSEVPHVQNFIDCVKSREQPYCDLETIGHPASVLCHAGNIAARVGRQLRLNSTDETFVDDDEANAMRGRATYRKPWILPEV